MKKLIILIFGLFLLTMADTTLAQIIGTTDPVLRRDTIIPKHNRDTIRYRDTLKRNETIHEKQVREQREREKREKERIDREKREHKISRKIDSTAKAVGHKGAELGAKAAAGIKDRSLENVKGPNGETVYVNKYDRRYYINKEGKKVYLKKPKNQTQKQ